MHGSSTGASDEFHSYIVTQLVDAPTTVQYIIREMTSKDRHEVRYQRRKAKRNEKKRLLQQQYADFDKVFSFSNLYNAFKQCKKGVAWKTSTKRYKLNVLRNTYDTYSKLKNLTYRSKGFFEFDIIERGKPRHIRSVHISERVVQRTLCDECLVPMLERSIIYDNSASVKGKGIDFAINRLEKQLHKHYRKYGNDGYVLQFDFKSYFDNIDHNHALKILRNALSDNRTYGLSRMFVKCFGDKGLGLGSQISQILAIVVPNAIDHYIKEELKIKGYARYMDDGYLIHPSKEYLKKCLKLINSKLIETGIILNKKKTQIAKLSHGFTFLKIKFNLLPSGKVLKRPCRKSITAYRRKLKKLSQNNKVSYQEMRTSFNSWCGHMKRTASYKTVQNMRELFNELYIENWLIENSENFIEEQIKSNQKKGEKCYV